MRDRHAVRSDFYERPRSTSRATCSARCSSRTRRGPHRRPHRRNRGVSRRRRSRLARGSPARGRVEAMWGEPGIAYVYRSYGIHAMLNVVTEPQGADRRGADPRPRAASRASTSMRIRRGLDDERLLCSGPGKLCQALGIGLDLHGTDLVHQRPALDLAGRIGRATSPPPVASASAVVRRIPGASGSPAIRTSPPIAALWPPRMTAAERVVP